jgi:hypothetical protein
VYGTVEVKEFILATFYSARQQETEDVSVWACRLKDILASAVPLKQIQAKDVESMLRAMLWTGLKPSLKAVSGHKFDTIQQFDELRIALRRLEQDHANNACAETSSTSKPKATAKMATPVDQFQELKCMMQSIKTDVGALKQQQSTGPGRSFEHQGGRGQGVDTRVATGWGIKMFKMSDTLGLKMFGSRVMTIGVVIREVKTTWVGIREVKTTGVVIREVKTTGVVIMEVKTTGVVMTFSSVIVTNQSVGGVASSVILRLGVGFG